MEYLQGESKDKNLICEKGTASAKDKQMPPSKGIDKLLNRLSPIRNKRAAPRCGSGLRDYLVYWANLYQSPGLLFLIIAVLICIGEAAAKTVITFLPEIPAWIELLVYSILPLVLVVPFLYIFLLRPLAYYITANRKAEERQKHFDEFKERIVNEREKQDWLSKGQIGLTQRMQEEIHIDNLCQSIICYLAKYINARIGILYLIDRENNLQLNASYAFVKPNDKDIKFKLGEGLVGQAALEKRIFMVTGVPDFYIKGNSEWGESAPHNILVMPFLYMGDVKGVIELASYTKFTDIQLELLNSVAMQIAVAFNTAQSIEQVKDLLERTQVQTEELQVQSEELKTANEELEEQAQSLKSSKTKLQVRADNL